MINSEDLILFDRGYKSGIECGPIHSIDTYLQGDPPIYNNKYPPIRWPKTSI